MSRDLHLPNRKSNRLKNFDYSNERLYFITICIDNKEYLFGEVVDDKMILNEFGIIAHNNWLDLKILFLNIIKLHEFVIMPNHIHGIVEIIDNSKTIGDIVGVYKSILTNRYIENVKLGKFNPFQKRLLQRNYYDHIIRDEKGYHFISEYIINNPRNWRNDDFYNKES